MGGPQILKANNSGTGHGGVGGSGGQRRHRRSWQGGIAETYIIHKIYMQMESTKHSY